MRKPVAWLVYIPLQILWLTVSLAGVIWTAYRQIWRSRALEEAGIDGMHVTFVAADLTRAGWIATLRASSYDPAARREKSRGSPETTALPLWPPIRLERPGRGAHIWLFWHWRYEERPPRCVRGGRLVLRVDAPAPASPGAAPDP